MNWLPTRSRADKQRGNGAIRTACPIQLTWVL